MDIQIEGSYGRVDEKIYGQFIEHILNCIEGGIYDPAHPLSDAHGIRQDVMEKLREMAPPVMRFPGGTVMCQYHWQDAVGPLEKRIRRKNLIWGGELDPSFGTCEFIMLCKALGAEPMICINMASGTPEEAANWVEYCNGTGRTYYADLRRAHGYAEPFNVKYWCIGNECYAEPDIGIYHDVHLYVRDAMEYIKFMKLTDKTIKTLIVGCDDDHWNKTVLDALHPVSDYLSYHHYSAEGGKGVYGPFWGEAQLKHAVQKLSELIDQYPETVDNFSPWYRFPPRQGKIKIALDEWNIWDFVPDETYGLLQTYNWRDALWTASVLNLLISKPEIGLANLAQSVNVLSPIVAEKQGSWYQTIAYPLLKYRAMMQGERLKCLYHSPVINGGAAGEIDAISAAAVRRPDGKCVLAIVNRDLEKDCHIRWQGGACEHPGDINMTVMQAHSPLDTNCLERNCVVIQECHLTENCAHLPPASICLIEM